MKITFVVALKTNFFGNVRELIRLLCVVFGMLCGERAQLFLREQKTNTLTHGKYRHHPNEFNYLRLLFMFGLYFCVSAERKCCGMRANIITY